MSARRRVVAIASNKGGVGKTTLAVNLAVLARLAEPARPVLLIGLDDQDLIDRMFDPESRARSRPDVADALGARDLRPAIREGRYGVHYVPTSPDVAALKGKLGSITALRELIDRSGFEGLVVIDTKSDLEQLTQNAIWASDLTLVPVADETSLLEAEKVFRLVEGMGRLRHHARVVLSLVDLRIKYRSSEHADVLAWLVAQIRARGLPLFETFVSRSPRIEALATNPGRPPLPVTANAGESLVVGQLRHLVADVLRALEAAGPERRADPRLPYRTPLVAFRGTEPRLVALEARDLSRSGLGAVAADPLAAGERVQLALRQPGDRPLLVWAHVARSGGGEGFRFERGLGAAAHAIDALVSLRAADTGRPA